MLLAIKKSAANILTIVNLLLGFISIILISLSFIDSQDNVRIACILIFIATLIDVFDGKVARKLGTSGDFGKELDSLADLVSFCLAPSVLIFSYSYGLLDLKIFYLLMLSSLPTVCGAIRLAKFNAYTEYSSQSHYLGLPTPSNALLICSSILFMINMDFILYDKELVGMLNLINPESKESLLIFQWMKYPFSFIYGINPYIIIMVCSLSSLLLISNVKYSKFPALKLNVLVVIVGLLFFIIGILAILNKEYHIVILFFISYYIVSGLIKAIIEFFLSFRRINES